MMSCFHTDWTPTYQVASIFCLFDYVLIRIEAEEQARREEDARRMAEEARIENERLMEEERLKKEEQELKKKKEAEEIAKKHEEFLQLVTLWHNSLSTLSTNVI